MNSYNYNQFIMMHTRLKYQVCTLHDEPLNYLCLHAKCAGDRMICAICKQERHYENHLTIPLKIYLCHKAEQLKCLTKTKLDAIEESLINEKERLIRNVKNLKDEFLLKMNFLETEYDTFFKDKINVLRECSLMVNQEYFKVGDMELIQKTLKIVAGYEQYQVQLQQKLYEAKQLFRKSYQNLRNCSQLQKQKWDGHPGLAITENMIKSKTTEYKIGYFMKPISKNFNRAKFRIISAPSNWIAVGVCKKAVVKSRKYNFRYHTIGHGVYALSSNGGIWSHEHYESNNKLGGLQFGEKDTITINYDFNEHKVWFENEKMQKFSLDTEEISTGQLYFCVVLYFQGDQVQITPQLTIIN